MRGSLSLLNQVNHGRNLAIGNTMAAAGMGYYLWRQHPKLQQELREHPLGEPMDRGADEPAA